MTTHATPKRCVWVVMNETPKATRGQCGPETRWLGGSGGTGRVPMCWQAGWQRDPTRMPAHLPGRTPHPSPSWESISCGSGSPGGERLVSAAGVSHAGLRRKGHRRDRGRNEAFVGPTGAPSGPTLETETKSPSTEIRSRTGFLETSRRPLAVGNAMLFERRSIASADGELGLEEMVALEPAQREEAPDRRQVEGREPVEEHGGERRFLRHPGRGEADGEPVLDDAYSARDRDERAQ
jgi:hypothetical protein